MLARAGFGSRRVCEDLIADGRVTVNGEEIVLGARVEVDRDVVEVDGVPIGIQPDSVYYLLNHCAVFCSNRTKSSFSRTARFRDRGPVVAHK